MNMQDLEDIIAPVIIYTSDRVALRRSIVSRSLYRDTRV